MKQLIEETEKNNFNDNLLDTVIMEEVDGKQMDTVSFDYSRKDSVAKGSRISQIFGGFSVKTRDDASSDTSAAPEEQSYAPKLKKF